MAVLTFSRSFGCGVRELAKEIAREWDYMFFEKEVIPLLFKEIRMTKNELKKSANWSDSLVDNVTNFLYSTFPFISKGLLLEDIFTDSLRKVILGLADQGNVIILGRGSQIVLKGYPQSFHIRFVADIEFRIEHLQKHHNMENISHDIIANKIIQQDMCRREFIKKNFKREIDDLGLYSLVIDVSKISLERTKEIIKEIIS